MRDDFAVMIITHGRPDNQLTLNCLHKIGYTGKLFLVVDDEDSTKDEYIRLYGDSVLLFHKDEWFDIGDNFYDQKNSSVYARNECFIIAKSLGLRYFLEMDDDFTEIMLRYDDGNKLRKSTIRSADDLFEAFCEYLETDGITCLSFATEGDGIGGRDGVFKKRITRKARNSFFCSVEKPFEFFGRF